jgi:hypothetical protein
MFRVWKRQSFYSRHYLRMTIYPMFFNFLIFFRQIAFFVEPIVRKVKTSVEAVFWNVTLCSLADDISDTVDGRSKLHWNVSFIYQTYTAQHPRTPIIFILVAVRTWNVTWPKMAVFRVVAPWRSLIIALMVKAARTSETLVNFYQTTRRYNPAGSYLCPHRHENLK